MKYYPVNLDLNNKQCLVVGGGRVAKRKIKTLLKCRAKVTAVSIKFLKEIEELEKEDKNLILKQKKYDIDDIKDMFLVIGATDIQELNSEISINAKNEKVICNIADCPSKCDFILPAFIERGDLVLSISTSGSSPAFAKKMRKNFETEFGLEYEIFLELMKKIRLKLLAEKHSPEEHKPLFEAFIEQDIIKYIKTNDIEKIDSILMEIFGKDREFLYSKLMEDK